MPDGIHEARRFVDMPSAERLAPIGNFDQKTRTFDLTFAAGAQVRRFDWMEGDVYLEELEMSEEAIDMTRLNAGAPLLDTHQRYSLSSVLGVVERAWFEEKGGKAAASVRFSQRDDVKPYEQDVADKIIRNVSVGYDILEVREMPRDKATGYRVMRVTRWAPFELSLVPVGADAQAQTRAAADHDVRRTRCAVFLNESKQSESPAAMAIQSEAVRGADETAAQAASTPAGIPAEPKERIMSEVVTPTAPAGAPAEPKPNVNAAELESARVKAITNLAKACDCDERFVRHWISTGTAVEVVSEELMKIRQQRSELSPTAPIIGMEKKEVESWSLFRAIRALDSGNWEKAGLELAASKAVQERTNIAPQSKQSILVPLDVLSRSMQQTMVQQALLQARRDLTAASASGGGYLVDTQNQGFVELLRNASVCFAMGATRLSGLQGNVTIPKRTAGATGYWLATEATSITESNQTFGQISMTPKTCGAYNEISRQLLMQSSPAAEDLVMSGLALDVGTAVDLAGLNGSGAAGQPLGVIGTSGIGAVTGTTFDYADIIEFQTDVATANALAGNLGYVTTPTVAGLAKARVKFTGTASQLWEGRLERGTMDGYPAMSSNQIPAGDMLFGDWSQMVIGEWGVLEIAVNQQANFPAGIIGVRALYSVDVAIRIAAAFSLMTGAT